MRRGVDARPAVGKRLARSPRGIRRASEARNDREFVAIEAQQLAGGAVGIDHLGPGVLDQDPLVDRVECGGGGEGRIRGRRRYYPDWT